MSTFLLRSQLIIKNFVFSLKSFQPLEAETEDASDCVNTESHFGVVTQKRYEPPEISVLYGVNAATSPLFSLLGCPKVGCVFIHRKHLVRRLISYICTDVPIDEFRSVTFVTKRTWIFMREIK